MADMLVKLFDLQGDEIDRKSLLKDNIEIVRAMPSDKQRIVRWVKDIFGESWASECDVAFSNKPVSCFVAIQNKKSIIGFACYEATCKDFFGPTGVLEGYRGRGIGTVLLFQSLQSMKDTGYAYAIIGGAAESAVDFYKKTVNAYVIEGSSPGIYKNSIG